VRDSPRVSHYLAFCLPHGQVDHFFAEYLQTDAHLPLNFDIFTQYLAELLLVAIVIVMQGLEARVVRQMAWRLAEYGIGNTWRTSLAMRRA
jgi:hypothetical protein